MKEEKVLQYLKVLCYLKSQNPDYISRRQIAEKFFNGKIKTAENICKHLIDANLISSRPGTLGGYTYDPKKDMNNLKGSDLNCMLNDYSYNNKAELNKINLSISEEDVIDRLSKLSFAGIPLVSNLKVDSGSVSEKEERLMIDITDAIRGSYKLRIKYTASQLNEDGSVNSFECIVSPINFTIFNGVAYLNAYYEKIKDSRPTGEKVRRVYVLNRIEILEHLECQNFAVNNEDRIKIKSRLPYELYDSDEEITFPIRVYYQGYNCFNRVFKNYYNTSIDIKKHSSIVYLTTKSYLECCGNLLALGNTFEFLDAKYSKKVRDLYLKTIDEIREKLNK